MTSYSEEAIRALVEDRVVAHRVIFKHRHKSESAPFHAEFIQLYHSANEFVVVEAFRKAAKTTLLEETVILKACLREFKNCIIIGASYDRAVERLESLKHEFETNEDLIEVFGELKGATWTVAKIILSNGVVISARGAGQSIRGVKHHDIPPDYCVIDDLEDEDSVRTPDARREMLNWVFASLLAALEKGAHVRFIGNRLDANAVIVTVSKLPDWVHRAYPILHLDPVTGQERATWPGNTISNGAGRSASSCKV